MSFLNTAIQEHQKMCDEMRQNLREKNILGPWIDELDRVEFMHAGLHCMIIRNPMLFNWCGYVGIEANHPFYEKDYSDIEGAVDIHGGLTFSNKCSNHICHESDKPDLLYWVGFDCAHLFDFVPAMDWGIALTGMKIPSAFNEDAIYRDKYFAIAETRRLAEQLAQEDSHHGKGCQT